jgi:hypothetical protein
MTLPALPATASVSRPVATCSRCSVCLPPRCHRAPAKPENRAKIVGIMASAALTSFLTGITEPIEFSFLFIAPVLYAIHAVLAGLAYVLTNMLGVVHGHTFSNGFIDFVAIPACRQHAAAGGSGSGLRCHLLRGLHRGHPCHEPENPGS